MVKETTIKTISGNWQWFHISKEKNAPLPRGPLKGWDINIDKQMQVRLTSLKWRLYVLTLKMHFKHTLKVHFQS